MGALLRGHSRSVLEGNHGCFDNYLELGFDTADQKLGYVSGDRPRRRPSSSAS
jgi:hypothetical protein